MSLTLSFRVLKQRNNIAPTHPPGLLDRMKDTLGGEVLCPVLSTL